MPGHRDNTKADLAEPLVTDFEKMLGGMAHEINNPLTIMMGQVNKLKKLLVQNPLDSEAFSQCLEKLSLNITKINKTIVRTRELVSEGCLDPEEILNNPRS